MCGSSGSPLLPADWLDRDGDLSRLPGNWPFTLAAARLVDELFPTAATAPDEDDVDVVVAEATGRLSALSHHHTQQCILLGF